MEILSTEMDAAAFVYVENGFTCLGGSPTSKDICHANCGDGKWTNPPEGCDDGNQVSGDGCSSTCTIETPLYNCINVAN